MISRKINSQSLQMFNTFERDRLQKFQCQNSQKQVKFRNPCQNSQNKQTQNGQKSYQFVNEKTNYTGKLKSYQLINFSTIQLNPWSEEQPKSPTFFEHQVFPSLFPTQSIKTFAQSRKYLIPKQNFNRKLQLSHQNQRKNWYQDDMKKKQFYLSKRKKIKQEQKQQAKKMNKTISVLNIEGVGLLSHKDRSQKTAEKQEKKYRTTINNPMYGKFCNQLNAQKLSVLNYKRTLNIYANRDLNEHELHDKRRKLSTYSIRRDPQRVKSIHQIRKKLKSTSQLMRRRLQQQKQQENKIGQKEQKQQDQVKQQEYQKGQISKDLVFIKPNKKAVQRAQPQLTNHYRNQINPPNQSHGQESIQTPHQCPNQSKSKVPNKKNLYIGRHKFFYPVSPQPQKPPSFKMDKTQLPDFQEINQLGLVRKLGTRQQFQLFQKQYNRIL